MAFTPTFSSLFGCLHRCHVLFHASRRKRLKGGLLHDVGTAARRQSRGAHGGKSPHRRRNCLGNGVASPQGTWRETNRLDYIRCFSFLCANIFHKKCRQLRSCLHFLCSVVINYSALRVKRRKATTVRFLSPRCRYS